MAQIDTIADRSSGTAVAGKAYFETSTNKFIVYNGSSWVEFNSDGTGSASSFSNGFTAALDGTNDYVSIGTAGDTFFDIGTNNFSCTFWIKLDSVTGSYTGVFGLAGNATGYQLYLTSGAIFQFWNAPSLTGNLSSALSTGQWYHVAVVKSSGLMTLYLNGTAGTSESVGSLSFTNDGFRVGDDPNGSFSPVNGLIDEFAFWKNYALTASEVSDIRGGVSAGTLGLPADISAIGTNNSGGDGPDIWLRMGDGDDGAGNADGTVVGGFPQVYDMAGSKDGSLVNGPSFSSSVPS